MRKIILESISKSYNGIIVLDIDYFEITLAGISAIIGWSGSGKTTLLNIISLMDCPDEAYHRDQMRKPKIKIKTEIHTYEITYKNGQAKIIKNGQKQIPLDLFRREVFGFIFQEHFLHPNLTIDYNIKTPLLTNSKTLQQENLESASEKLGILKLINKYPRQISGGEAQRASILRGVMKNSPVIFGDEITNNLDYEKSKSVLSDIKEAITINSNELHSFIWVSHDIHLIAKYADTIITIRNGRLDKLPNQFHNMPGDILNLLEETDNFTDKTHQDAGRKKQNVFSLLLNKKASFIEKQKYFISYAYNDLFNGFLKPTTDLAVVYFSILLVLLFLLSILKISYGTNQFLVMKLSDPRINSLEVTTSGEGADMLSIKDFNRMKQRFKNVKYISPLYYTRISIQDRRSGKFRSAGNAITFRKKDPVLAEIIGHTNKSFLISDNQWAGIIIHKSLAKKFGCADESRIQLKFNYFNRNEDQYVDCLVVDTPLPFSKKMMIREAFYINSFKKTGSEENPGIQYIVLYPKTVKDTYAIKSELEANSSYQIYEAFKLSGKLKIINEMKKNMKMFVLLSVAAILILTVLFIVLTVFRNMNKKQKEFGVFLAFGMPKRFFLIFYSYEGLMIWLMTTVSAYCAFLLLLEKTIDNFLLKSNVTEILGKFHINRIITPEMLKLNSDYYYTIFGFELFLVLGLYIGTAIYFARKQPVQLIRS